MSAENRQTTNALQWVVDELKVELEQALLSLERYVENTEKVDELDECVRLVGQIENIFSVTDVPVAAMLANELIGLAADHKKSPDTNQDEVLGVLAEGVLAIGNFLSNVNSSNSQIYLISQINNVRAMFEGQMASESQIFNPDMDAGLSAFKRTPKQTLDSQTLRKLRTLYQRSVLSLIKDGLSEQNLSGLQKVFKVLYQMGGTAYLSGLGFSALAMTAQLKRGASSLNPALKIQFKRFDEVLRKFIAGLDYEDTGLLKNILFYVVVGGDSDDISSKLIRAFRLNSYVSPSDQKQSVQHNFEPELVTKVVDALSTEIEQTKVWVDNAIHETNSLEETVTEVQGLLSRMRDTLVMIGADEPRESCIQMLNIVEQWATYSSINDVTEKQLEDFAAYTIQLTSELNRIAQGKDNQGDSSQFGEAQASIISEGRQTLTLVKNSITNFINGEWQWSELEDVPSQLAMLEGALRFYPLPDVSDVVSSARRFLREGLLEERQIPDESKINRYADIIIAVDYYLECLERGTAFNLDFLVERARENCADLGYPCDNSGDIEPSSASSEAKIDDTVSDNIVSNSSDELAIESSDVVDSSISANNATELSSDADNFEIESSVESIEVESTELESTELENTELENTELEGTELENLTLDDNETEASALNTLASEDLDQNNSNNAETIISNVDNLVSEESTDNVIPFANKPNNTAAEENFEDDDDEIVEIFIEEAEEILEYAGDQLIAWRKDNDADALIDLRRGFHTLKGGGRMVGATLIGELSWALENMLNRVIDKTIDSSEPLYQVTEDCLSAYPELLTKLKNNDKRSSEPENIREIRTRADQLSDPSFVISTPVSPELTELMVTFVDEAETLRSRIVHVTGQETTDGLEQPPREELAISFHTLADSARMAELSDIADSLKPLQQVVRHYSSTKEPLSHEFVTLLSIWSTEFSAVLKDLRNQGNYQISELNKVSQQSTDILYREEVEAAKSKSNRKKRFRPLHRLMAEELDHLIIAEELVCDWRIAQADTSKIKGLISDLNVLHEVSAICQVHEIEKLSAALHSALNTLAPQTQLNPHQESLLFEAIEQLLRVLDAVASWQVLPSASDTLLDGLANLKTDTDSAEQGTVSPSLEIDALAGLSGDNTLDELTKEEQASLEAEEQARLEAEEKARIEAEEKAQLEAEKLVSEESLDKQFGDIENDLLDLASDLNFDSDTDTDSDDDVIELDSFSALLDAADDQPEEMNSIIPPSEDDIADSDVDLNTLESNMLDEDLAFQLELTETFIEEAEDLIGVIDQGLSSWRVEPTVFSHADQIHRALHTLKGGARLSGLNYLGTKSHDFESYIIDNQVMRTAGEDFFIKALHLQDELSDEVERIRGILLSGDIAKLTLPPEPKTEAVNVESPSDSEQQITAEANNVVQSIDTDTLAENTAEVKENTSSTTASADPSSSTPQVSGFELDPKLEVKQDLVRLSGKKLDEMVNLSGEATVYRGRIEARMNELDFTLEELEGTIGRIQTLARRLDVETEAQVQFRAEQIAESDEEIDFDPLEMDRYSMLQQLSRQLIESASDLQDLRLSLENTNRDSEVLLTQSARIQTELNDNLMRARMVPFSQMVPRLKRMVRQLSRELNKPVELIAQNVEGELDRQILDQLNAPLEHIIRNSIDHGIESSDTRLAQGKAEQGKITLTLRRDGSFMVIRLADDGAGLNIAKIRQRALERQLDSEANLSTLSEAEIADLIFTPGFSTSDNVTQISGRGVGMDVVRSTVRKVGGTVNVHTNTGQGSAFELAIPFTLSVNRALMVKIGEDSYALPLTSLEALVRVTRGQLEDFYQDNSKVLHYGNEVYQFGYLGELLQTLERPPLESIKDPSIALVLFRSGERRLAVQVDEIMASQEIVLKSLARPFNDVPGLSGAAIMGDGSVVVTLDMITLIQSYFERLSRQASEAEQAIAVHQQVEEDHIPNILVVDDSVTVRKVTSRFLSRNNFVVDLARDGVDALRVVHDHKPDLMLVDVEMPRMDGFELLSILRATEEFKEIPVILITSRTGEKHRERGLSLGANRYFGKPYREDELLESIHELLHSETTPK